MWWTGALAGAILLTGCTGSSPVASRPPTAPSPSVVSAPATSPTPSPEPSLPPLTVSSPAPLPIGMPVARRVLAPAAELPIAALCSYRVRATADGNFTPLFCRPGAINVLAWGAYVQIGPNVMSIGRSATLLEVETAMCRDARSRHSTNPESGYAYEISAAYHGWQFAASVSKWLSSPYDPNHRLC